MESFQTRQHFPMVVKFPHDCGHICHDEMESRLGSGEYYSIIDSTHALLYTSKHAAEEFLKLSNVVTDVAPLLPELKIDSNLHVDSVCSLDPFVDITLLLLPIDESKLIELRQFIFIHTEVIEYNPVDLNRLRPDSENLLTLSLKCPVAVQLVKEFSERSEVQWIERFYKMKPAMRWASPVTQSGKTTKVPMHRANLTGLGHVIGIADTGIDGDSCFFVDPDVPVPYNTINHQHRKIVMYEAFADNEDADEHGTLVSGCAAGYCLDPKANAYQYNGVAYEAKIAFVDIGKAGSQYLTLPSNQYSGIYQPLYDAGARVMSMSWGDTSNSYTSSARYNFPLVW